MKTSSIAFLRAIVLSLCLVMNSGFLALAAEGDAVPPPSPSTELSTEESQENLQLDEAPKVENTIELVGDDEILVGVTVNNIAREEGLVIFLPAGSALEDVMVPLGAISEMLSYAIEVNAGDKKAEGFFMNEANVFQLNLNSMEVLSGGERRPLEENEAEVHEEDIFVRASSMEKWFGVKVSLDMSELVLRITSDSVLPFQERMARLKNAERQSKKFVFDPVKPENAQLAPYRNFSYPALYITGSLGLQQGGSSKGPVARGTLQGNQDIAGFEADYTFGNRYTQDNANEITNARLTFQRRDNNKNLLGPLKAGRISFGDVAFPSVPLFLGGQRGAGVEISSDSRLGSRYATNSENFILDGDAPVGWDAELYRNGAFIAFQQIGSDGRYFFENVSLNSGFNNFEIILYGPQGQKTSIKREVARGPRLLRQGELQYDFAAGTPEADFLPFADNAKDDRTPGMSGQLFYGFSRFFTMGASVYSGPQDPVGENIGSFTSTTISNGTLFNDNRDDDESTRASGGAISAATSFLGVNLQGQVLAADKGRKAYEAAATTRALGFNLGASHTEYKNFLEDDQDIESKTEIAANRSIGRFNLTFRALDRTFIQRENDLILEQITAFKFFNININNDLVRTISDDEGVDDFEGEVTALAELYGVRVRGAVLYDLDPQATSTIRRLTFSGQKSLDARTTLRMEGSHEFDSEIDTLNLRYSKDFSKYGLDFDVNANSEQNYSFTVGMRVALQPGIDNRYRLVDPRSGGLASLGMRAFIDENNNNIYDPGIDEPISDVAFKSSTRSDKAKADKEGVAYLTNLGESPARISVQQDTIPDIYLTPKLEHRDIIPRRGSTPVIDFPFTKMSEIAGYLTHLKEGVEGVVVKLLSDKDGALIEETQTDSDGYYIFPAVKGGNYKVSFGLPERDFMSLNVVLDPKIETPEEMQVEASDELAQAAKEAAEIKPSASNSSSAAQRNIDRMNAPAGDLPNIDDPLDEEDLKPLEEKDIESIITQ